MSNGLHGGKFVTKYASPVGVHRPPLANWTDNVLPLGGDVRATTEATVSATEEPTFFGPAGRPLFGVLHLPAGRQIRGGVLICGSVGKEGTDSVRLQRIVADTLATRGFAVLRFDYLGTGDSAYAQERDEAVDDWLTSIEAAADYLTSIGAESITAIGHRAGTLLLNNFLQDRSDRLQHVAYFDPVGTGRRYLREHTTLYRLAVGENATLPGVTPVIGARLSERAAAMFSALRFDATRRPAEDTLMVLRPTETDSRVTEFDPVADIHTITGQGLAEFAQSADLMVPMPLSAADEMIDWIDRRVTRRRTLATPVYARSVSMPAVEPNGISVVERIERIGSKGLFGIRTMPGDGVAATGKSVLFFVTANDSHHGPSREWVELSRRVAAAGSEAVRWDRAGLGSDGQVSRDQWQAVYSTSDIGDAVDAARHTTSDPDQLELVGVCSGSWYATHVARAVGAGHIVMVNQAMWGWRVFITLPWQWNLRKSLYAKAMGDVATSDSNVERARKRIIAAIKPARNRLVERSNRYTPRWLRLMLGRLGVAQAPEVVLASLARAGTDVTLIASPWDVEQFDAKGGLGALSRLPRAEIVCPTTGDHSGYHPAILSAIRDVVLDQHGPS